MTIRRMTMLSLVCLPALLAIACNHEEALAVGEIGARQVAATRLEKGTFFVSPTGSSTGRTESDPCSLESLDLFKRNLEIRPGDVVIFRGGVYNFGIP